MKKLLIVIGLAVVAAAGWFFVSPLFIDEVIDEAFIAKVATMSDEQKQEIMPDIMDKAANAPDQMNDEAMPAGGPRLLSKGLFVDADPVHKGSGDALLYALEGGDHLVRFENFRTTNGPALVVYLAEHGAPTSASDVTDGGYIKLGKLKGNVGNQNYPVPSGTDIGKYNSVVIWCELFGVLFSPAALTSAG
ncbi:MAG: DM13 domain-containing protein [Pseudomonadota bacterium]